MDVWFLNSFSSLYQFFIGLTYAPLAAVMTGMPMAEIPTNLWHGFQCVVLGRNFVVPPNCSVSVTCDADPSGLPCCDSCDGSIPTISGMSALFTMTIYMAVNIV